MSILPTTNPACSSCPTTPSIATIIDARPRDVGGFEVGRLLPSTARRLVGPFIYFDHMGPAELAQGEGLDVPPHPHIGLATVTYLFEGEIIHRDSLGSHQPIRPGDVNWMSAGRGIVHSERTSPELRTASSRLDALQLWLALPVAAQEAEPEFHHHAAGTLPALERDGARIRVVAGTAYGETSPVRALSSLFYVDVEMPAGCRLSVPGDHEERATYVVKGAIDCGAEHAAAGRMLVFTPGVEVTLRAASDSRIVLLGGAPIDGKRYIDWNFVSNSKERLAQARLDWKERRFPKVPGDEVEFMPLPE